MNIEERLKRVDRLVNQLTEQDEKYEAFLNASPWGILVVDSDYYIVFANERLCATAGWEMEDLLGQHLHVLIAPKDRDIHEAHEKEYKKHPRVRLGDHPLKPQLLRKDGTLVDVEISLAPTVIHGQLYVYASIRERDTFPDAQIVQDDATGEFKIEDIQRENKNAS